MSNNIRITITIVPTNTKNEEGYKTGLVTVYKDSGPHTKMIELEHWKCDSFIIRGDVHADFEVDGGVRVWSYGKQLKVSPGYTTIIYGYGADNYDMLPNVVDIFSTAVTWNRLVFLSCSNRQIIYKGTYNLKHKRNE